MIQWWLLPLFLLCSLPLIYVAFISLSKQCDRLTRENNILTQQNRDLLEELKQIEVITKSWQPSGYQEETEEIPEEFPVNEFGP